jgi:chlorobactene glucosyltransferase
LSWLIAALIAGIALWTLMLLWSIFNFRGYYSINSTSEMPLSKLPRVSILVPARNEADMLPGTLPSLLQQEYPNYEVVLVDDGSSDGTGEMAESLARRLPPNAASRLRVIRTSEQLPAGWVGKNHALHTAFEFVSAEAAPGEWVLATDADIVFHPKALRAGLFIAEQQNADLVSIFAFMRCESFWEKIMMPGFALLISSAFPQRLINSDKASVALASGGYILMRRELWSSLGGYRAIQSEMIDDLNTARLVKHSGHRIFASATRDLVSTRMYSSFREVWEGLRKNAFAGHRFNLAKAVAAIGGYLLCNTLPLAVLCWFCFRWLSGGGKAIGAEVTAVTLAAAECFLIGLIHLPVFLYLDIGAGFSLLAPLAGTLYAAITLDSVFRTLFGQGVSWKSRRYGKAGPVATRQ